ncbi:MFS transporter [Actinacidiphila sp. DG2A-62]|uniref:MFS transporter n=1 Tax=Actinacidiphila sp. DG2A-62 TaxID=3108821 RepID=UPI002DBCF25D|nr:MFS transporter [Actinacidiphila sp. DG2A-62]MEC3992696.1 MFS transporter [Actinacidiphila sp. DG2A-62]
MTETTTAGPHRPVADQGGRGATLTTLLACLGVFVAYVPVGGVSVALPTIQRGLRASTSDLQWISDSFVLAMAALILTSGLIGDKYGRKKAYLGGMVLFAVGCAVNLTAHGAAQLWVGQAVSGAGAAALLTSTLALISHAHPDFRTRAKAIAAWATCLGLGMALGPLLTGVILEHASWRWIFLPALVVAAAGLATAVFLLEDSRAPQAPRLDVPGQVTALLGIAALVYAVIEGGSSGWGLGRVVAAFAVAAVSLTAFVLVEQRSDAPMLRMSLFASRAYSGAGVAIVLAMFALVGLIFLLSLFFGQVQGLSALQIAWRFLVPFGLMVLSGPVVARLMNRAAPGLLLVLGLVVTAGGCLALFSVEADSGFVAEALPLVAVGVGFAFVMTPITAIAVGSVPHHLAGMAGAGSNTLRQAGGALGPAVLGAVLTSRQSGALPGHLASSGLSPREQTLVHEQVSRHGAAVVARLGLRPDRTADAGHALALSFTDALHVCLALCGTALLAAAVLVFFLVGIRRPVRPAAGTDTPAPTPATVPRPAAR